MAVNVAFVPTRQRSRREWRWWWSFFRRRSSGVDTRVGGGGGGGSVGGVGGSSAASAADLAAPPMDSYEKRCGTLRTGTAQPFLMYFFPSFLAPRGAPPATHLPRRAVSRDYASALHTPSPPPPHRPQGGGGGSQRAFDPLSPPPPARVVQRAPQPPTRGSTHGRGRGPPRPPPPAPLPSRWDIAEENEPLPP